MAIDKVVMMNIVGRIEDVNSFANKIYQFNDLQMVNAIDEIEAGRFIVPIHEDNIGELIGISSLTPGYDHALQKDVDDLKEKFQRIYEYTLAQNQEKIYQNEEIEKFWDLIPRARAFYEEFAEHLFHIKEINEKLQRIETNLHSFSYLKEIDVKMDDLKNLQYFNCKIGSVTKDNAQRLKSIYADVTSLVFHVGTDGDEEIYVILSPLGLSIETDRILNALNFKPLTGLDVPYEGTPSEIIEALLLENKQLLEKKTSLGKQLVEKRQVKRDEAVKIYNLLCLHSKLNVIKRNIAFSDNNFYFSAWVAENSLHVLKEIADAHQDMRLIESMMGEERKPPTKFKNNWVLRPFEYLVSMYGTPSHNELDPTPFLAITYLFCFGYMFGDVGQGALLILIGFLLAKKEIALGSVLTRMGIASTIFGFLYGSVFGMESIIPAIWMKPFDDINRLLLTAIVTGVAMLLAAYAYSIINKLKAKDWTEGFFGKNGVAGLLLYLSLLVLLLGSTGVVQVFEPFVLPGKIISIFLALVILVREPLYNAIQKRKLYEEGAGDYYVENVFEVLETFLSMFSNTVSFIRIGAFALTHAGLFMAFETLAQMVGGGVGGTIVFILGNILIFVLEGLINFIQSLRLQFYELFSKYYTGNGYEFVTIDNEIKNTDH